MINFNALKGFNSMRQSFLLFFLLVASLLIIPQVCEADIINGFLINFPVLFVVLTVLGVIAIEAWIIKRELKQPRIKSVLVSFLVNGVTGLIGVLLYFLYSKVLLSQVEQLNHFLAQYWFFVYLFLFVLTLLIEALILRGSFKEEKWSFLLRVSIIMNILSYLFIFLFILADWIMIGSVVIVPFIICMWIELLFSERIHRLSSFKRRLLKTLLWAVLIIVMVVFLYNLRMKPQVYFRAHLEDRRIITALAQMRTFAEIVWSENEDSGYSFLCCAYNKEIQAICEEIKELTQEYPTIHANKNEYCVYVKSISSSNMWFCIDSRGGVNKTSINPGLPGYCTGKTFICPSGEKVR